MATSIGCDRPRWPATPGRPLRRKSTLQPIGTKAPEVGKRTKFAPPTKGRRYSMRPTRGDIIVRSR